MKVNVQGSVIDFRREGQVKSEAQNGYNVLRIFRRCSFVRNSSADFLAKAGSEDRGEATPLVLFRDLHLRCASSLPSPSPHSALRYTPSPPFVRGSGRRQTRFQIFGRLMSDSREECGMNPRRTGDDRHFAVQLWHVFRWVKLHGTRRSLRPNYHLLRMRSTLTRSDAHSPMTVERVSAWTTRRKINQ